MRRFLCVWVSRCATTSANITASGYCITFRVSSLIIASRSVASAVLLLETSTAFRYALDILVALYIVAFNLAWTGEKDSLYYLLNGLGISSESTFSVLVVVFAIVGISGWLLEFGGLRYVGSKTAACR